MAEALHGASGVAGAVMVMLVCVGQFVRNPWPGLLFWFGTALGAGVAQALVLWAGLGGGDSGYTLVTLGAIGGVLGMLAGGAAADLWQERREPDTD